MKISEVYSLSEAPLPDDWDKDIYDPRVSFNRRIAYAKERASKLGTGSSRVVFNIKYNGRETALKIAINRKGYAQNRVEADILSDAYMSKIVIPLIDYDTRNGASPTWVHTEKADRISKSQLAAAFSGVPIDMVVGHLAKGRGDSGIYSRPIEEDILEQLYENDNFAMLEELLLSYRMIMAQDLMRPANWGLYRGRPVIIDIGFTDEIRSNFYM